MHKHIAKPKRNINHLVSHSRRKLSQTEPNKNQTMTEQPSSPLAEYLLRRKPCNDMQQAVPWEAAVSEEGPKTTNTVVHYKPSPLAIQRAVDAAESSTAGLVGSHAEQCPKPVIVRLKTRSTMAQRVPVPLEHRDSICLGLTDDDWKAIELLLDKYAETFEGTQWLHGTTSASLVIAQLTDGKMMPAGKLLENGLVPLSGESGNALSPFTMNKKGMSGVDINDMGELDRYTNPEYIENKLDGLWQNLESIIRASKEKLKLQLIFNLN